MHPLYQHLVPPFAPAMFSASHSTTWACPLCCKVCVCWVGLCAAAILGFLSLSPRSVWGAVKGLRSVAFSVSCPPRPCFVQFSKTSQLPFGPVCEGVSQCAQELLLFRDSLSPSLRAQAPAQNFSVFSFLMSLSSLLPHFRELSLSPGGLGSSAVAQRLLCRSGFIT